MQLLICGPTNAGKTQLVQYLQKNGVGFFRLVPSGNMKLWMSGFIPSKHRMIERDEATPALILPTVGK